MNEPQYGPSPLRRFYLEWYRRQVIRREAARLFGCHVGVEAPVEIVCQPDTPIIVERKEAGHE